MLTIKDHIKQSVIVAIMLLSAGCSKMLELYPEDKMTREDFWQVKADVESATIGAYSKLQGCVNSFYTWGELRGELNSTVESNAERKQVYLHQITQENSLCSWGAVYAAINTFNVVIDFAPLVLERDNTFSQRELDQYIGEALTMRALCYFYLARTFETFPFITEASKTDEQTYTYPGSTGSEVLKLLVTDLLWAEGKVRRNYNDVSFETVRLKSMYEKGRVTQPVVWALLTDIYLATGEYDKAVSFADKLINDSRFELITGDQWFSNFYPGNSNESVFELQFSREYENAGSIMGWFGHKDKTGGDIWYAVRRDPKFYTFKHWEGTDRVTPRTDYRGEGGTFPGRFMSTSSYGSGDMMIWKWAGKKYNGTSTEDYREQTTNDINWIFYRLADICLMKAEALNAQGRMKEAAEVLKKVRDRAGVIEDISYGDDQTILEGLILDERASELAFEGKRWFDLVRIARRQNNYEIIANRVADAMTDIENYKGIYKSRLTDPLSWYFPINRSELEVNPKLVQNKYYQVGK